MLNICLCQLIKDEQRYIEEWIDHYINLGVSKFMLFEDWNSSSHANVLLKYGDKVKLQSILDIATPERIRNIKETRQEVIWEYVYNNYKDKYDACLFVDVDEYISCNKNEFLEEVENIKNTDLKFIIYVWQTMTASGHIKDPHPNQKYSIVKTYTDKMNHEFKDLSYNSKSLIFMSKLDSWKEFDSPHGPGPCMNSYTSKFKLNHYLTKSWEEYKNRIYVRGEPVNKYYSRKIEHFFEINNDLLSYKNELLKECDGLISKHNVYE